MNNKSFERAAAAVVAAVLMPAVAMPAQVVTVCHHAAELVAKVHEGMTPLGLLIAGCVVYSTVRDLHHMQREARALAHTWAPKIEDWLAYLSQ